MSALVQFEIERAREALAALDGRRPPRLLRPVFAGELVAMDVNALARLVMKRVMRALLRRGLRRRLRRARAVAER